MKLNFIKEINREEMTQEEKELLLKDISARLPYGIKCQVQEDEFTYIGTLCRLEVDNKNGNLLDFVELINGLDCQVYLSEVKPYLFPLSSMTEEQKKEYEDAIVYHDYIDGGWAITKLPNDEYFIPSWFVDFCNKNHFDYRGLIPMGLAKDATGLKIY